MNVPLKHKPDASGGFGFDHELSVRYLDRQAIFALGEGWQNLSCNCVEENPYYSPRYMLAMLEHVDRNCDVKALAIYKRDVLVGFLPFYINKWRWLGHMPVNQAWKNSYVTLTIPLVAKQCPREVVEAMVRAMGQQGARGHFWLFMHFNLEGPVGILFDEVLKARNLSARVFDEFSRPILDQGSTFDQHMLRHVSNKRRRDLKRNRKRLNDQGKLEMRWYDSGAGLESAVEDFLRIEASGWKGAQGTALACDENLLAFARRAFGGKQGTSITRADVLYLDNRAIAVSLAICVGQTAFTPKCAYDESYRTYSPGLLLEQDIIEDFLHSQWAQRLDSATVLSGHVVQGLWNSKIRVGDFLLCADGARTPDGFGYFVKVEQLRRFIRKNLKYIVTRFRGN